MMTPTVQIVQIDNGYIVTLFPQPDATGVPNGTQSQQYCADKNAVATYLVAALVPGGTYTPPPAQL
jgi:hypothetical protein